MKYSIRTRLFTTFIWLIIVFVTLLFIITNLVLDDIIIYANKSIIENIYEDNENNFNNFSVNDEVLKQITTQNNVGIVVYEKNKIDKCYASFMCTDNKLTLPTYVSKHLVDVEEQAVKHYFLDYKILNVNELIYIYNVDNQRYIIVSKPLDTINDINNVIRPFIAFSSLISLLLGSVAIYFISKKITDPIVEITEYANMIANQEFDKKISIDRKDELGKLADNMNYINAQLSKALSELKTDLEKEKDMDKKRVKFFSAISHELKTPITIIQGYADGLKHNIVKNKKDITEYSQIIIDETKKMNRLINDLLNLSLFESENFKLNKEQYDLKEHIVTLSNKYVDTIKKQKINLQIIADDESYLICSDKYRIEQVFLNLLRNAIKYIDDDGVIRISLIKYETHIMIKVFNNGEKIAEDELNQIWNAFYKLESSKNYSGTGLGLAIVRSIVELHNGTYGVSNMKDGVEFTITLPYK